MRYILLLLVSVFASTAYSKSTLPVDPAIRQGKLENGLHYYIRHNEEPKERADFYIVFDVGAILEEDAQNGLAHFTEHMAFNGTKHFPDKGVLNFLERQGVKFGNHINAFTSQDITCYNMNDVPVTNPLVIDSALLILNDWSSYISLLDEEIDAERAVVHEEWRTRMNAGRRLFNKHMPAMFNNSKYTKRDVIGTMDIIDNFEYQTIRDFYHDWYRTDLQAVVVVGDIDVDEIEKKIKTLFNKIPKRKNPKQRYYVQIPNNKEPLISIATDPEQTSSRFSLYYKHDVVPEDQKNENYIRTGIVRSFVNSILNQRVSELLQKPNPAFIAGSAGYGELTPTKDAYQITVLTKPDTPIKSLEAMLIENKRLVDHGITAGELERQKINFLKGWEVSYNERDKRRNNQFVWESINHYLTNEPMPSIDFSYDLAKKACASITLEELNAFAKTQMTEENIVVTFSGPEKEGVAVPTKEQVLATLNKLKTLAVEPYKDEAVASELLDASAIKPGSITKTTEHKDYDYTEYQLGNGIKVLAKTTDFQADQILMTAFREGGTSAYGNEYVPSLEMMGTVVGLSGLGDFTAVNLQKVMTGKSASASPFMSGYEDGFSGSSTVKDFETMFQLLYLYITKPRFDAEAFEAYKARLIPYLENQALNPMTIFRDTVSYIKYNNHPRIQKFNAELVNKVDMAKIEEVYRARLSDFTGFTFVFVGNVDKKQLQTLAKKYLASLPTGKRPGLWKDNMVRPVKHADVKIPQELEVKKATVNLSFNGKMKYTLENEAMLSTLKHVLQLRYTESVREKAGGAYGVRVGAGVNKWPYENYYIGVGFDCDHEKLDMLMEIVHGEIAKIAKEGPLEKDLQKAKEYFTKVRGEDYRKNGWWLGGISHLHRHQQDYMQDAAFKARLDKVTPKSLKAFMKQIDFKNYVQIINVPK